MTPTKPRQKKTKSGRSRQTLLILGASGDLTGRLLLPGLAGLLEQRSDLDLHLMGAGVEGWSSERWQRQVRRSCGDAMSARRLDRLVSDTTYQQADVTQPEDLQRLLDACEGQPALYFALPPPITAKACDALTKLDLPTGTRLVLEKPFGTDAKSAGQLNDLLARLVPEDQVHRVDHFLGKSTVLNILGLRFGNRILEPILNAEHVERVEIVFDETLGLEKRARYYDGAGAMVDMIQSHLLQVLSVMAMEAPPTITARDLRDRKAEVLRATRIWGDDPETATRRGRYTAGKIGRRRLSAYVDEKGIDPARGTETLAEVDVEVRNWRWAGVPFRLRSGKALGANREEIVITFKDPQRIPDGLHDYAVPNRLRIALGPDSLALELNVNGPGDPYTLDPIGLRADFGPGDLEPYGEVLAGVLDSDPTLSVRGDTAVDCWRIIEPVLRAWRDDVVPLDDYPAGSEGPKSWR